MRTLPAGLEVHLDSGATTLCWCWRLTRRDGTKLGFTDHDRDLGFDGTTFEAAAGFTASDIRDGVGLSVSNLEVESALSSDRLSEEDILGGLYDDARVEIWRVNWTTPIQRVLVRAGSLGELKRAGPVFTGEVRGLAHYLQQPAGRLFQFTCDADLGDHRCKFALATPPFRAGASVASVISARIFSVAGLDEYATQWFSRGLLSFISGANASRAFEVKRHVKEPGRVLVELWQEPPHLAAIGDTFTITAGCDKQLQTCTDKFANTANFRGFPHLPGNDFVTAVASSGRVPTTSAG